jgi:hypothetical protein
MMPGRMTRTAWPGLMLAMVTLEAMAGSFDPQWLSAVSNRHDLTLPAWGPYTKQYIGISHVPATNNGVRFDLSVFPGFYRRKSTPPNVWFESGYHPWEATPDLSYYSHRHELEWKDRVYADVSFTRLDDQARLIRVELVNHTPLPQNLVLHLLASIHFPSLREYGSNTPIHPATVELPAGAVWVDALDYQDLRFARPRPTDNLVYDGKWRGEFRADGFVNGSGLGCNFGADPGDEAEYEFELPQSIRDAQLLIRHRVKNGEAARLRFSGLMDGAVSFAGSGRLTNQTITLGVLPAGRHLLRLVSEGGAEIQLDGVVVVSREGASKVKFTCKEWTPTPEIFPGSKPGTLILKYADSEEYYGLAWDYPDAEVRQFLTGELDVFFQTMVNNHVKKVFQGEGDGHFTDVFLRPITLAPRTANTVWGMVCNGTWAEVERRLAQVDFDPVRCAASHSAGRSRLPDFRTGGFGDRYQFSQERMAATLLCNVVYPVYTQRSYIKHYTPGRWWDSLYTWDAGFIGLGLAELDERRAFECLNTYLTEPGAQSAFVHHGSMVPVQFYLFQELWNRSQSEALLEYVYPRLRQYYEFYVGRLGSSSTAKFKSGLLSSFDYFYNSGGWDDYPPQKFVQEKGLRSRVSAVVTTAQAIRIARIMQMAADAIGRADDLHLYEQDIKSMSRALQKYSWDDAAGCFSYVLHDGKGSPVEFLRHESGTNFNLGMDGIYPLVAGIGTSDQTARMLARLKDTDHLWSRAGLTAVDQSAPYYCADGYWNGTVWMPHQWFFWKSMLDLGEGDFAWQIAKRALDLWQTEVDASYNCMEHFLIESGRGAGWHQFGALSSPVLKWHSACCRPGTLTAGFNVRILGQQFSANNDGLEARLKLFSQPATRDHRVVLVCLNPEFDYTAIWNGISTPAATLTNGLLSVSLPATSETGMLVVRRKPGMPEGRRSEETAGRLPDVVRKSINRKQ